MTKRILVVDADAAVREALGKMLSEAGYEVTLAANPEAALEYGELADMDMLLLDFSLPTKNGWDAYELIASQHPALPIIITTGQTGLCDGEVASTDAGAYLEKPLDVPKLLKTIQNLLAESKETRLRRLTENRHDENAVPTNATLFFNTVLQKIREQHVTSPRHSFSNARRMFAWRDY